MIKDVQPRNATRPLTIPEAADLVSVSTWTVRAWIRAGHLPKVKIRGRVYVREADVLTCDRDRRRHVRSRGGAPRTLRDK